MDRDQQTLQTLKQLRFAAYAVVALIITGAFTATMSDSSYASLGHSLAVFAALCLSFFLLEVALFGAEPPAAPGRMEPPASIEPSQKSQEHDTSEPLQINWRFHRTPLLLALVVTLLFYGVCAYLASVL